MYKQLQESLGEFDKNYVIIRGGGREGLGDPEPPYDCLNTENPEEIRQFITTHTIKLLENEIDRLEGMRMKWTEGEELLHIQIADGYNQAISDQISYLQEQIKKINSI